MKATSKKDNDIRELYFSDEFVKFYDMLQDYNRHDDKWRKIWGKEDAAERDMETLLRFCALKKYVRIEQKN